MIQWCRAYSFDAHRGDIVGNPIIGTTERAESQIGRLAGNDGVCIDRDLKQAIMAARDPQTTTGADQLNTFAPLEPNRSANRACNAGKHRALDLSFLSFKKKKQGKKRYSLSECYL